MSILNWKDLTISMECINAMELDQLEGVRQASDNYMHNLAHGISGIGNLLACAASNEDAGLNVKAVANVGWMLESLGGLVSSLSDTTAHASSQIEKLKAKTKKVS
jgi:hypothetical protein